MPHDSVMVSWGNKVNTVRNAEAFKLPTGNNIIISFAKARHLSMPTFKGDEKTLSPHVSRKRGELGQSPMFKNLWPSPY